MASVARPRLHPAYETSRPSKTKQQKDAARDDVTRRKEAIEEVIDEVTALVQQRCEELSIVHKKNPEFYRREILGIVRTVQNRKPNKFNMYKEARHAESRTSFLV